MRSGQLHQRLELCLQHPCGSRLCINEAGVPRRITKTESLRVAWVSGMGMSRSCAWAPTLKERAGTRMAAAPGCTFALATYCFACIGLYYFQS